jgi:hypothetical protein
VSAAAEELRISGLDRGFLDFAPSSSKF